MRNRCAWADAVFPSESKSRRVAPFQHGIPLRNFVLEYANPVAKEVFPVGLRFLRGRFHPAHWLFYTPSF